MQVILDMLEGKKDVRTWNNIHNASMHMMLKFDGEELRKYVCPDMPADQFVKLTPKEIGAHLEAWFQSLQLDTPDLESKMELEGCLIPKAGQHRAGGILRFVIKFKKQPANGKPCLAVTCPRIFGLKKSSKWLIISVG